MLGLIYKDFLVMKRELLLNILVVIACSIFMNIFVSLVAEDGEQFALFLEAMMYLLVFSILGGLQNNLYESDENEYYSSFIISTPLAVRGQVVSKYYETLIFSFAGLGIGMINDLLSSMIIGYNRSSMSIYMTFFFIQIALRAIDTPFLIRYGQKYGKNIKLIMISVAVFMFIVYGLFGPLPKGGISTIVETVANWLYGMENMSVLMMGVVAIFPYIAVIMFYISYRISLKMYLKGVTAYE